MLADKEIRAAHQSGELQIEPFVDSRVQGASYDLSVGRVLVAGRGIVDPAKERVILRTGDWVEIESREKFELSTRIAATYGVRSSITRRGIDWFGGPQIDPGYKGRLFVSVFNPTTEPFEIVAGMPMFTMIFHRLNVDAEEYSGSFQGQYQFPEEDVERMLKMSAPTLADVVMSVGVLENVVEELTRNMQGMARDVRWVTYLLGAILISLVVGLAIGLPMAFLVD